MTDIEKFRSDVQRIVKRERAENGGRYDPERACGQAVRLLETTVRLPGDLPRSAADYWLSAYIAHSASPADEPTAEHIDKLTAIAAFLCGNEDECGALSDSDWKELGRLTGYEAEELPLDVLSSLMTMLVDRKAV
jgi:hypothetical protein